MKEVIKKLIIQYGVLIVATLALIQPWIRFFYKRFFRKGRIDIFPTGTMQVGYSGFGPTIGLNGTFRCINQGNFVQSIDLKVIKHKDDSKHYFHWTVFRSQKLTLKGEEAELELPYSFMINISQPKRYNILFADMNTRDEMQTVLRNVYKDWKTSLQKFVLLGGRRIFART